MVKILTKIKRRTASCENSLSFVRACVRIDECPAVAAELNVRARQWQRRYTKGLLAMWVKVTVTSLSRSALFSACRSRTHRLAFTPSHQQPLTTSIQSVHPLAYYIGIYTRVPTKFYPLDCRTISLFWPAKISCIIPLMTYNI